MNGSWVDETCPPGWDVAPSYDDDEHYYATRIWLRSGHDGGGTRSAKNGDGCTVWCDSEVAARRLAWERWALEVLSGRVEWYRHSRTSRLALSWEDGSWLYVRRPDGCPVYEIHVDDHDPDEPSAKISECTDPVEALARLAGLVLAVFGPEVGQ